MCHDGIPRRLEEMGAEDMKCANCGAKMGYGAFCPTCGSAASAYRAPGLGGHGAPGADTGAAAALTAPSGLPRPAAPASAWGADSGSVLWPLPGVLLPQAGPALWMAWRRARPRSSAMCGIGFRIGTALLVLLALLVLAPLPCPWAAAPLQAR